MKQFLSIDDVNDVQTLVHDALAVKRNTLAWSNLGKSKTLGMIFMNPSLRTRLSMQKAAMTLGMNVMVMNVAQDGWRLEMNDGVVMDGSAQEHIKEAARVISGYCDLVALRTFASLEDRQRDYSEEFLMKFVSESSAPIVNMESATVHPLQSLADIMTIDEHRAGERPRVVLTWAPHPKALPQAVAKLLCTVGEPNGCRARDYSSGRLHP